MSAASETIQCPSGLVGEIRGLKVKELNILADPRLIKGGRQVDKILTSCWMETQDAGPYDFGDKGISWDKVLQGDRFFTLLKIRSLSLGESYVFDVTCNRTTCREHFEWELSLSDLPVKPLPEGYRDIFKSGNRFETKLPSLGKRIWFRLAVGADEERFAKLRQHNRDRLWSAMLALRIVEIENVKDNDKRQFIEELDISDAEFLRKEFDVVDCGVETTIEVECPECMTMQEIELPLGRFFFTEKPRPENPLAAYSP